MFRAAADLTRFLGPELAGARWPRARAARRLLKLVGHPDANGIAEQAAGFELDPTMHDRGGPRLPRGRAADARRPGAREAIDGSRRRRGAARLALPARRPGAGRDQGGPRLGLPSAMLVWSWDNLSSKAVAERAPRPPARLERAPGLARRPSCTGSRRSASPPSAPRTSTRSSRSCNAPASPVAQPPTILYLGSSPKVAPAERTIFERWLEAVRASRAHAARRPRRPAPAPGGRARLGGLGRPR